VKVTQGTTPHTGKRNDGGIIHEEVVLFNCTNLELNRDFSLGGAVARTKQKTQKK